MLVPHPMLMLFTSPIHQENLHNCKQNQQRQPCDFHSKTHNSHQAENTKLTTEFLSHTTHRALAKDNPNIKPKTQNEMLRLI